MPAPRRLATVVSAAALATALTACGGGVGKDDFVAKADAACTASAGAAAGLAKPSNLPELSTAAATLAAAADAQAAGLRGVKASGDDTAAIARVSAAVAEVVAPARALQDTATKADDAATGRAANELMAKVDAAATQAQAYGLVRCAKDLRPPATTVFEGARSVLKAAFVARADSLCLAANRKVDALAEPKSLTAVGRYLAAYLPIETKLFADIKALAVPPGDEAAVADMLAAQEKVIEKDKEAQAAAQRNNRPLFDRLNEEDITLVTAANAKFDAYDLPNCGTLSAF